MTDVAGAADANGGSMLHGFGVTGYRSLYATEPIRLSGLGKVNLIVGPNNSGKSNLLNAIERFLPEIPIGPTYQPLSQKHKKIDGDDVPQSPKGNRALSVEFAWKYDEEFIIEPSDSSSLSSRTVKANEMKPFLENCPLWDDGAVWFRFNLDTAPSADVRLCLDTSMFQSFSTEEKKMWGYFRTALTGATGGSDEPCYIAKEALSRFLPFLTVPQVRTIGRLREIAPTESSEKSGENDLGGKGLIERLQKLQNPKEDIDAAKARFHSINKFVSDVFEEPDAFIEIPYDKSTIFIGANQRRLPIESVGSGLHQLIIIAAAAATEQNSLICIEEPETNMHPLLQRKLLRYLATDTSNQYVIATHSAAMIDLVQSNVFAARLNIEDQGTTCEPVKTPNNHASLAMRLGYRASDIVQSNAIIWVEGPSDRIYLRRWISLSDADLVEGQHYSIMFYGGALLNHLSEDSEITDLISLSRINRNSAILIDSDCTKAGKDLNETKTRVKNEFNKSNVNGFAWITDGYTIENYVPYDLLSDAVLFVHPTSKPLQKPADKFENPLNFNQIGIKSPDKIRIASKVIRNWSKIEDKNLAKDIERCVRLIRSANHG